MDEGWQEKSMVIEKLSLNDFRGIRQLDLDLEGKSAVLFGINGVGKSSVLAALNLLYANIINRLVKSRFKQAVKMEISDIRYGKASARIKAEFRFGEEDKKYTYSRTAYRKVTSVNLSKELDEIVSHYREKYIPEDEIDADNNIIMKSENCNIPIFVNYGVNRLVLKTPLRIRKTEDFGQFAAFEKAIENQIAFSKLFEWFLEQEIYETQQQKLDSGYRDIPLNAVKRAMLAMLDGYKDIHITSRPYSMKVFKGQEILDILQLSDGEKCTLALFGDLARRLAIANPSLKNPLEGEGVVLIDEVELHMHTSWQRKVIQVLRETFPKVQFLITTHSPQVLGEIDADFKVFSLYKENGEIVCDVNHHYFGLDANSVLEEALLTDAVNAGIKDRVSRMYDSIERKDFDQAEKWIQEIDELTKGRNIDTVRGKVLVRKGRKMNALYKKES